ncbi:OmpA family protein [Pontibacter sp. H249]|uniref:OmpA family protein n=1 Tax=Pontibacter sp. H249 TaxID=3133420 RepID=UPI0030C04163
MKALLLFFLFYCVWYHAGAQNMVKNPSLETIKDGIVGFRKVSGTPDVASKYDKVLQYPPYYNSYLADLPTRSVASIQFGDLCLCHWFSESSSELTQAELRRPLKKNKEYIVSLYTIKASVREPAIEEITVYFTKKRLPSTRKVYGIEEHALTGQTVPYLSMSSSANPVLSNMGEWVKVSGIYKAKGGERYITIGNFIGANKQALEAMNPPETDTISNYVVQGTYYCYDNISVVPKSEKSPKEPQTPKAATFPFAVGTTITLSDVNFETGSHVVLPLAFPTLDSLAAFLKTEPDIAVRIIGHTDNVGSDEDNLQLSIRRAKAVMEYLVTQGINQARIAYEGYGENRPKVDNNSERNRALNRRVEIELRNR